MSDRPLIKVVGMGPFPLPGEKKRWKRAEEQARRDLALAEAADQRGRNSGSSSSAVDRG